MPTARCCGGVASAATAVERATDTALTGSFLLNSPLPSASVASRRERDVQAVSVRTL
jgi:hypothetical protein